MLNDSTPISHTLYGCKNLRLVKATAHWIELETPVRDTPVLDSPESGTSEPDRPKTDAPEPDPLDPDPS